MDYFTQEQTAWAWDRLFSQLTPAERARAVLVTLAFAAVTLAALLVVCGCWR